MKRAKLEAKSRTNIQFHKKCGNARYFDHNVLKRHMFKVMRMPLKSQKTALQLSHFTLFELRIVSWSK